MTTSSMKRGALVVLEGCDKAGKTTQARLLVKALENKGIQSHLMFFPNRSTDIGKLIDRYLKNNNNVENHAIHLLFSANRWEAVPFMKQLLAQGITLIVDRYAFSGVAFSAAKKNFTIDWCKTCDIGLPKPDLVLYFNGSLDRLIRRPAFGDDHYEDPVFQQKVRTNFALMMDETFRNINAERSIEVIHREVLSLVIESMHIFQARPILNLWEKYPSNHHQ